MKHILILSAVMILLAGNLYASPVTLTNTLSFSASDAESSGDGEGRLIGYAGGSVNHLEDFGDYIKWSHSMNLNQADKPEEITGKLSLKLRNEDTSWFPDIALGFTDQGQWGLEFVHTGSYNYNVITNNGELIVTLLSLNGGFFLDSSELTLSYDSNQVPAPVPEPSSMVLIGISLTMAGYFIRKRTKQN